jgi:hypothetical protein
MGRYRHNTTIIEGIYSTSNSVTGMHETGTKTKIPSSSWLLFTEAPEVQTDEKKQHNCRRQRAHIDIKKQGSIQSLTAAMFSRCSTINTTVERRYTLPSALFMKKLLPSELHKLTLEVERRLRSQTAPELQQKPKNLQVSLDSR